MKKVFVTGASGFFGKSLLKVLTPDVYDVSILSRSQKYEKGIQCNLSDIEQIDSFLKDNYQDVAVLLAWEGLPDYSLETSLKNHQMQINLISSLIKNGCKRIILAGSCWQYGKQSGEVKESAEINDVGLFGAIKNSIYEIANALVANSDTEIAEARVFYSYGPGQRKASLIPSILSSFLNGKEPEVRTPGDAVDFIYIDDVAQALKVLVDSDEASGIYNVSSGESYQIADVVNATCDLLGKENLYNNVKQTSSWWGNNQKLCKLGFKPNTNLSSGVNRTYQWLKGEI